MTITKEYRIPMPLGVEEYRIAQLYMIAKKSRLESEGEGSGVEILVNEPYSDGPGGGGQYTDKLYYIGSHLPIWMRSFIPKSLSTIKEEAWNAYPYSKNKICTPFMDRFSVEIESKYLLGGTKQENVFQLSEEELSGRVVDVIDFVNESLYGSDYVEDEDPRKYKSEKSNRGPLAEDWLEQSEKQEGEGGRGAENEIENEDASEKNRATIEHGDNLGTNLESKKENEPLMCVYKICRVEFDRWPVQYKVEQFIHDYIRKTLVRAHRQAWAWQDEWHGLTMDQIREMERETQECLSRMMRKAST